MAKTTKRPAVKPKVKTRAQQEAEYYSRDLRRAKRQALDIARAARQVDAAVRRLDQQLRVLQAALNERFGLQGRLPGVEATGEP